METRTICITIPAKAEIEAPAKVDLLYLITRFRNVLLEQGIYGAHFAIEHHQSPEPESLPRDALAEPHCRVCGGTGAQPDDSLATLSRRRCLACDGTGEARG